MAKRYARSHTVGAGFQQRIFHPGHLPLHGLQGLANDAGPHPLRQQVADFLDLQEIVPGEGFADGNKFGALPRCQLPGRDAQQPKNVRSTELFHVSP